MKPVFVVGASRSGTNLVRAILNAHSSLWISAETHYFDDLRPRLGDRARVPLSGAVRDECERYFLAQSHRAYGRGGDPQQGRIGADELRALAQRLGGSGDAYFEAFCRRRAELHGKPAWGEKTPRHVYRIADVLDVFPDARIVCLLRDPRAVVASYRDWHRGAPRDWLDEENAAGLAAERERSRRSYHPLLASLLWRGVVRAERDAERRFGRARVIVLRFEELAADPEACVRGLCERLGLEFEQQMLEVPVVNSSYAAAAAPGVSSAPVERWRAALPAGDLAVVQRVCGPLMDELGYERADVNARGAFLRAWSTLPIATVRAGLANRRRIGKLGDYVRRRGAFAFGSTRPSA